MIASALFGLLLTLAQDRPAPIAQPSFYLYVEARTYRLGLNEPASAGEIVPVATGQPMHVIVFQAFRSCGPTGGARSFPADAIAGWSVDVTPGEITSAGATFEIEWIRERDKGKPASEPKGHLTVRMRPGDELPLDLVTSGDWHSSCQIVSSGLAIRLGGYDRRLLSTDLWLMDKAPDGSERQLQQLTVRSALNEPVPFHFDGLMSGQELLDVPGRLTIRMGIGGRINVEFEADQVLTTPSDPRRRHWGGGTLMNVGPGEVFALVLPTLEASRNFGQSFASAGHQLSVRARVTFIRQ